MHEEDWKLGCSTLGKNYWLWLSDVSWWEAFLRKGVGTSGQKKMTTRWSSNRKTRSGRRITRIGETITDPRTTERENPDGAAQ